MSALALRMLARDWRAGELRILGLAMVIAVASVTSVGFFADRVRQALTREAHQLLGADLVIRSDHPWGRPVREEAARRALKLAENAAFISMARAGEAAQLASVKAVSSGYPLRGRLRIAMKLNGIDADTDAVPERGYAWIDERLALALSLVPGGTLELGNLRLRIGAILTLEPDRGVSFFNIAPRLMMNIDDVPATGLVQTGSRVSYDLLFAGDPKQVEAYEKWLAPRLGRGESMQSLANARPEIRASLDRAQKFTGLTSLLAVILAAVAVSLGTRRYTARHLDAYAVMRCLGASQRRLVGLFAGEFGALGVIACALGCLFGYAVQFGIAYMVAELIAVTLPQPSLVPALQGFLIGLALLLGFALPPLLQLSNVSALRVIRRDIGPPRQGVVAAYGGGLVAIAALLVWQAGEAKLGLVVAGGFALAFVLFGGIAYAVLQALGRVAGGTGLTWRYGFANLRRRARANVVQIVALSLGLTAILLLSFTRGDLLDTWKAKLPADAPNRFVINIQPEQRQPLLAFFRDNHVAPPDIYPMVRGRYVRLNGASPEIGNFDERERHMMEREFNLSYMDSLPRHNSVLSGHWFNGEDFARGALSVEEGIARSLGWKVGDRLGWQVAGQTFTAPIVNLRKLDWDSMQVNFFVIATPGLLREAPTSYITSFYLASDAGLPGNLPDAGAQFANRLAQRFPTMTVIDMSAILGQAQRMMDQVIRAVQLVFLFAVGAGVLVLYSALLATQDERVREAAVMRALGASRSQVLASQRAEFAALGLLAGLLAAAGATAIGYVVAGQVFQFPYHGNYWVWIAGPLFGLACVTLNVIAGARVALGRPPILALRES